MKIIGFNLTKISAEKSLDFKQISSISTDIKFTDCKKDSVEIIKDQDAIILSFLYEISYFENEKDKDKPQGSIAFEGKIGFCIDKDNSKEILKSWKKNNLPEDIKLPLFNLILRKCTPQALQLEDQISLPSHIPLPQVKPSQKSPDS